MKVKRSKSMKPLYDSAKAFTLPVKPYTCKLSNPQQMMQILQDIIHLWAPAHTKSPAKYFHQAILGGRNYLSGYDLQAT